MPNSKCVERQRILLDGVWDFTFQASSVAEAPIPPGPEGFQSQVEVPGWWDAQLDRFVGAAWYEGSQFQSTQGPIRYLAGIGWHRREFTVPEDWEGRPVKLTVGRAVTVMYVWLNGEHLGRYDYGVYTPFELDLTGRLRIGESNEIVIGVDNVKGFAGGWAYLGNAGRASGITQSVTLTASAGAGRIADLFIEPGEDLKEVKWTAELEASRGAGEPNGSRMEWEVWDAAGERLLARGEAAVGDFAAIDPWERRLPAAVGRQGTVGRQDAAPPSKTAARGSCEKTEFSWRARIDAIEPWSDRYPNLYYTRLRWVGKDGSVLDMHGQRFGLRRYTSQGRKLFLNGQPLYLRGSFGHYYFPETMTPPTDKDYWRTVFLRTKELGFNFVNFAAQVAPVEMLEAADEEGIILQCGDHETVLEEHRERYEAVWRPIVRWTRRHPSLAIYGFGGERNYYEGIIEQYQKQHDLIKELNPEALVMPQQAIRGIDYSFDPKGKAELTDQPFPHHAERLQRYTRAADLFGHYSGRSMTYTYDEAPHWQEMEERFRLYEKPLIHHELFMGACYLDPENGTQYTGRTPPFMCQDLERRLRAAGLFEKWPAYYRNSVLLQETARKYNFEKVRKCRELTGFELLALYDMHYTPFYTVGILDEFMRFKNDITTEDILRYNGESVLLIDYDDGASLNRAFYEKTSFEADVHFSYWGEDIFEGGTFTWELTDDGKKVAGEPSPIGPVDPGGVVKIRSIRFIWPAVRETTRLNLRFRLSGGGKKTWENNWDFWVFPRREAPVLTSKVEGTLEDVLRVRYPGLDSAANDPDTQLIVVSEIQSRHIEHLERGGDVLLLGAGPFPIHDGYDRWRPGWGGRSHQNVGTVIADHPVFENLPHDGWGDWHFYPILNGATPILIDEEKMGGFEPIVEVISSAADIRKQAVMFERRVGKGRLFVSSAVVDLENPANVALLDGILRYVTGPEFKPALSIDADVLRRNPLSAVPADPDNELTRAVRESGEGEPWSREPVTVHLDDEYAYRVGSGPWQKAAAVTISQEGITRLSIRKDTGHSEGEVRLIRIDATPPTVELSARPALDQTGGEYSVSRDALFTLTAHDSLSGVERIEYQIDGGEFLEYEQPFSLPPGRHTLAARAIDRAGNVGAVLSGTMLSGGATTSVVVTIK